MAIIGNQMHEFPSSSSYKWLMVAILADTQPLAPYRTLARIWFHLAVDQ